MNKNTTILIIIAVILAPFIFFAIILLSRTFTISNTPTDPIEIIDNNKPEEPVKPSDPNKPDKPVEPVEPKEITHTEILVDALVADEVIHIRDDYWSYKIKDKFGVVTSDGKIVAALYDQHFFNGVSDQICSYKNNDFVGFVNDLDNEIECHGFGLHYSGFYYDSTKKWMFENDLESLIKANPWFDAKERPEVVQKVIVGDGSSEEVANDFSLIEEYSIAKFTQTDSSFTYIFLTDFDYTEVIKLQSNEEWFFVVKDKASKWGLLDNNGIKLIEPKYERFINPRREVNLFTVLNGQNFYVVNRNDKVLFKSENNETFSTVQNNRFWINRDGKWYIVKIEY